MIGLNSWTKEDTFILDFKKAFNTSPHELFKSKLLSYGIGGKTLKLTDSFLCFRQQRVAVNGVKSDCSGFVGCPPWHRSWSLVALSVHKWHLIRYWVWNKTFADDCYCYREIQDEDGTSEGYWSIGFLGKEVGYEVSTCQMQYDAADKKTDQEDTCFIYLRGNRPWKRWKH